MNRNMDNLDLLPDNELRTRLIQYGFPNLPITGTTRKTLIKKLRTYMENEKSKLKKETSNATRYSSGEESDGDHKRRYSRTTTTPPSTNYSMPPPITTKTRRTTYSTNQVSKPTPPPTRSSYFISPMTTSDRDENMINHSNKINSRTTISPILSSSSSSSYNNNSTSDYLDTIIRNRYPNSNSTITPPLIRRETSYSTNGYNKESSPYLSEFTKRLLRLRGETVETNTKRNSRLLNDREIVHHAYETQESSTSVPYNVAFRNFINKFDEYYGIKQTFVPCLLVTALIIFFSLVGFLYLTISPDIISNLNSKDTTYTICKREQIVITNCIDEHNLEPALTLLRDIVPELQRRIVYNKCKDSTSSYIMTSRDIIKYAIERDWNSHVTTIIENIKNAAYLIDVNPQWRINNVDLDSKLLGLDKVKELIDSQNNAFAILNPRLPLFCLMYNKLKIFSLIVGAIALFGLLFYFIRYLIIFVRNFRQTRKDQLNTLVNDIINAAIEQASKDSSNSLLVLNHLRDKLIPVTKRKELEWYWREAIKFLENTESRLQFEIININGEDCKAIKWIDTITNNLISSLRSSIKKWQSPAFDKTNKIKDPPTPCLKIRQMFDKYEANDTTLKTVIQDAILEKVGNDCKIYDIQLDTNTCCVYVRCAGVNDAGIVHDEINGWWFDKRLVSIKFVRLERYLNRFPKSLSGPTCLRPSNTKKLSLSQFDNTSPTLNDLDIDDCDETDEEINENGYAD